MELVPAVLFIGLPAILVVIDFIKYCMNGKRLFLPRFIHVFEGLVILGLPLLYLSVLDFGLLNDCCSDSATFSPEHRLTIYSWIVICMIAYFYSRYRQSLAPPIVEIAVNSLLLSSIILNFFIAYHVSFISIFGNLPIILLFIIALMDNQKRIVQLANEDYFASDNFASYTALWVLTREFHIKYPILLLLILPLIVVLTSILILFGQKPDSLISAFTDTYKHGFSELDHLCKNVECGEHYLCSVAANGHTSIVKPTRLGVRHGAYIICNRQLLIANAFEDLIQKNAPQIHHFIRTQYNKVGNIIHRYYGIFENKFLSDFIYILMKPLEWFFIIILYTFDKCPENRISRQYLDLKD